MLATCDFKACRSKQRRTLGDALGDELALRRGLFDHPHGPREPAGERSQARRIDGPVVVAVGRLGRHHREHTERAITAEEVRGLKGCAGEGSRIHGVPNEVHCEGERPERVRDHVEKDVRLLAG